MSNRSSGDGQLSRIMRRLGSATRFNRLGTPQPGQEVGQGVAQPRPPAQGPAAGQAQPPQQTAPQETDANTILPEGEQLVVPSPGDVSASATATAIKPGDLPTNVDESPSLAYWRKHGMMPNFFSLQVMATRRQLEVQLGRAPSGREIAQQLGQRDASEDAGGTPVI